MFSKSLQVTKSAVHPGSYTFATYRLSRPIYANGLRRATLSAYANRRVLRTGSDAGKMEQKRFVYREMQQMHRTDSVPGGQRCAPEPERASCSGAYFDQEGAERAVVRQIIAATNRMAMAPDKLIDTNSLANSDITTRKRTVRIPYRDQWLCLCNGHDVRVHVN